MAIENRNHSFLENSRSHTVALIVSDISNPFFAEIIPAIEERLGVEGFVVFVGNTSEDRKKEERLLAKIREFPPDGVLICPVLGDVESLGGTPTLAGQLPIVAFARRAPGIDYAGIDKAQGAQLAVEHLYQLGNQRIAFIGRNTASLLELENPPTAAVCFNDLVAFGLVQALQQAGRKPGAEFGVIGFNDVSVILDSYPLLTTVDTSPRQLGEVAAELLLRRIAKPDSLLQKVILQPRLIVRHSCGC
jgi:LacI family transcriptional regulator